MMAAYDHLLGVDLGRRAGTPPPKPYVSEASREQVRLERWLEATAPVRDTLVAGLESLEAGADPGQVACRVVDRLLAATYHRHLRTVGPAGMVADLLDDELAA